MNRIRLKISEARMLVYLNNVPKRLANCKSVADKLGYEYSYTCKCLSRLYKKGVLKRHELFNKTFYQIIDYVLLGEAYKIVEDRSNYLKTFDPYQKTLL